MERKKQVEFAVFLMMSICGALRTGNAQSAKVQQAAVSSVAQSSPSKPPVIMKVRRVISDSLGMGDRLKVVIDSLREAIDRDSVDPQKFVLYLNGHAIWNVHGELLNADTGIVEFRLERADTSHEAWVTVLGRPTSRGKKDIAVGVGYGNAPALGSVNQNPPRVTLTLAGRFELFSVSLIMLLFVVGFLSLVRRSNIIRDASPPFPPAGYTKPYSLSRFQMAVWFFLVLGAYVFLSLITHSMSSLNEQALILIGIGTGTALGAAVVDNSKRSKRESQIADLVPERDRLQAEIQALQNATVQARDVAAADVPNLPSVQLAEKRAKLKVIEDQIQQLEQSRTAPVSKGFLNDILSDGGGISLHRFQMVAWTIVLGLFFIYAVWDRLTMPQFTPTLLALMGISAGTYLGFKVPEDMSP